MSDPTELHAMQQQLIVARADAQRCAFTAEPAGLGSRRRLRPALELPDAVDAGLMLLDLEHLKSVNDRWALDDALRAADRAFVRGEGR